MTRKTQNSLIRLFSREVKELKALYSDWFEYSTMMLLFEDIHEYIYAENTLDDLQVAYNELLDNAQQLGIKVD